MLPRSMQDKRNHRVTGCDPFSSGLLTGWSTDLESPNAAAQQPVSDHLLKKFVVGPRYLKPVRRSDGTSVRHVLIPIPRQGPIQYVLQAETSLILYQETRMGLMILLTLGSGIILLVAWVGSGWLAKKY